MNPLIIVGAGGHAREVAQLVADINQAQPGQWNLLGFVADLQAANRQPKALPAPLLGDLTCLARHPQAQLVVAIGNTAARREVVQRLRQMHPQLSFATLVHPRAWLAQRVVLGEGSVVFAGALINVDVCIGAHASLNLACTISHDCVLEDFVNLGPGAHLGGACTVGAGVDVGVGASVRPEISLAAACVIGAGAAVVKDAASACLLAGVPARPLPPHSST